MKKGFILIPILIASFLVVASASAFLILYKKPAKISLPIAPIQVPAELPTASISEQISTEIPTPQIQPTPTPVKSSPKVQKESDTILVVNQPINQSILQPTTFTTPSGAILDKNGNIINQEEVNANLEKLAAEERAKILAAQKQKEIDDALALKAKQEVEAKVAEEARLKAIDDLKKDYGLRINQLQAEILDLGMLREKSEQIYNFYKSGQYVEYFCKYLGIEDTQFRRDIATSILNDLKKVNFNYLNTPESIGKVRESIERQITVKNNQIAILRNELERKLLELQ